MGTFGDTTPGDRYNLAVGPIMWVELSPNEALGSRIKLHCAHCGADLWAALHGTVQHCCSDGTVTPL